MSAAPCQVGSSNFFSGLLGGYTGSYIFSLTIFNLRQGRVQREREWAREQAAARARRGEVAKAELPPPPPPPLDTVGEPSQRLAGAVVVLAEAAVFVAPVSVAAYLPSCMFGATLTFIAADLMHDWLVQARHKVAPVEFAIVWATFVAINLTSLTVGMLIGVGLTVLQFAVSYAAVQKVRFNTDKTSRVSRHYAARRLLRAHQDETLTVELHGPAQTRAFCHSPSPKFFI